MVVAGVLAACAPPPAPSPTSAPAAQPTAAPTAEPFKVALIVAGELADGSWNQFQYESLQAIDEQADIAVAFSENVDIPDFERVAGDYCRQGYDLIVAHTFDFQEPALKVAENCGDTKIAVQGAWQFSDNVAGITVWPCEGGYLAGVLGGLMTQTNKLGLIGGFTYAPTQVCFHEAFKAGALSVNPDVTVAETWTGTWYDVAIGYEAGNAMIDDGVDFIAISLSGPGFGAIDAAKDHNAKGGDKVYAVGAFVDMYQRAPDTIITSTLWQTTEPTLNLINVIRAGQFEGKNYEYFMADGSTDLAPYHELEGDVPAEVQARVDAVRQEIINGTLEVPIITEAPASQ
jgi:basic membrane protein A